MTYRRTGRSGLDLPLLSLGYWHNFGDDVPFETQRAISRRAFDLGITHHDLANNYGPPYGAAEVNFGRLMREDFRPYRDEMVVSTKAGWDMWPGPYGQGGGSRKYVLASLDQSLQRMGLDYVDIFYSHRLDASTPLEETMGALHTAVQQGKALYVGISSYDAERTRAGRRDPARPRHAAPHPPAVVLDAQPLDRDRGAARRRRRARLRRHRVHRARAGPAHGQVPGRGARRTRAPPRASRSTRRSITPEVVEHLRGAERRSPRRAGRPSRSSPWRGRSATSG